MGNYHCAFRIEVQFIAFQRFLVARGTRGILKVYRGHYNH